MEVARNDPCPCGSGKKYKKCCLSRDQGPPRKLQQRALILGAALLAIAVVLWIFVGPVLGKLVAGAAVIAVIAYLVFGDPPSSTGQGNPGAIRFGS